MLHRGLAAAIAVVLLLAGVAGATTYNWTGGTGGNWSDTTQWDVGGSYPSTKDDVGILGTANDAATHDAASSGVVGGMQLMGNIKNRDIIIDRDVLVDYTGTTGNAITPAGWIAFQLNDSNPSYYQINAGNTLSITGYKQYCTGNYTNYGGFSGTGTLEFLPDATGTAYVYVTGTNKDRNVHVGSRTVDFSAATTVEAMGYNGTGVIDGWFEVVLYNKGTSSAYSKPIIIGRTDGTTHTFGADASVAGTASGKGFTFVPTGDSRFGPYLQVNAVGTDTSPNLIVMEKEGLGSLNFSNNSGYSTGGCWIEASGPVNKVARLVLEGNFTVGSNYYSDGTGTGFYPDIKWDTTQIQLQMAGEQPASQTLRYAGTDHNAGGTGDLFDFSGLDADNFALRKLIIGSDEGTAANHVNFELASKSSALYCYGLEFTTGGYLNIVNEDDYVYYLGELSEYNGIQGAGLVAPGGLANYTNRPENIIMLGEGGGPPIPEPAGLGLIGMALLGLRKRRS